MTFVAIIVSGSNESDLKKFLKSHDVDEVKISDASEENGTGDELLLLVPAKNLDSVYALFQQEAVRAWREPDNDAVLDFDHALSPERREAGTASPSERTRCGAIATGAGRDGAGGSWPG